MMRIKKRERKLLLNNNKIKRIRLSHNNSVGTLINGVKLGSERLAVNVSGYQTDC
jgi:tmRNA-binding protein